MQTIEALSIIPVPELALRLFLQCAEVQTIYSLWNITICRTCVLTDLLFPCFVNTQAANDCDLEPVAYEFFTQAYILYEEEISVIGSAPVLSFPRN